MKNKVVKNCIICDKQFETIYSYQKTCSSKCYKIRNRNTSREGKKKIKIELEIEKTKPIEYNIILTLQHIDLILAIIAAAIHNKEFTAEQSLDIVNITLRLCNAKIKKTENAASS